MDNLTQQKQPSPFYSALIRHIKERIRIAGAMRSSCRHKVIRELNEMAHEINDLFEQGVEGSFKNDVPGTNK